jgi:hypothetical protein
MQVAKSFDARKASACGRATRAPRQVPCAFEFLTGTKNAFLRRPILRMSRSAKEFGTKPEAGCGNPMRAVGYYLYVCKHDNWRKENRYNASILG